MILRMRPPAVHRRDILGIAAIVGATFGVAVIGGVSGDFRSDWYARLRKPRWQPSGAVIGSIWTGLYASIAVSGGILWLRRRKARGAVPVLFIAQWVLNAAWTPLFTRARRLDLATLDCAALAMTNAALVGAAWPVSRRAALLLMPYTAWSAFATFLSWTIYRLNPQEAGSATRPGEPSLSAD
jgi:tryptophan-rich sensory protein